MAESERKVLIAAALAGKRTKLRLQLIVSWGDWD